MWRMYEHDLSQVERFNKFLIARNFTKIDVKNIWKNTQITVFVHSEQIPSKKIGGKKIKFDQPQPSPASKVIPKFI